MARAHEQDEERDFDAEFETFLLEHDVHVTVEEVFHLNPFPESAEEIRRHHHVVVRSGRSKKTLSACMTSWNWDGVPLLPTQVLFAVAAEARLADEAAGNFLAWAEALDLDPDSRGAERKFRQAGEMAALLKGVLGERAYGQLLVLQGEAGAAMVEGEEEVDGGEFEEE